MKHLQSTLACALCSVGVASVHAADSHAAIALHDHLESPAGAVLLGDVATIRSDDLQTITQLVNLPLGSAPAGGQRAILQRDTLARWIRARLALGSDQLAWSGATAVVVQRASQTVSGGRLERVATDALRTWLAARSSHFSVDVALPLHDLELAKGGVQILPRALTAREPTSRMTVWLDLLVDGRPVRVVPVSFHVDAYGERWVAAGNLPAGTRLDGPMLSRREVKLTAAPALAAAEIPANALRTVRTVKAGEPLTAANTANAPAVARGDWVAVHVHTGGIELEQRARALQDGELGQIVQVRGEHPQAEPISARVVARGEVEASL